MGKKKHSHDIKKAPEKDLKIKYLEKVRRDIEEKKMLEEEHSHKAERRRQKLEEEHRLKLEREIHQKIQNRVLGEWVDFMNNIHVRNVNVPNIIPDGYTIWISEYGGKTLLFDENLVKKGSAPGYTRLLKRLNSLELETIKKKFGDRLKKPEEYEGKEEKEFKLSAKKSLEKNMEFNPFEKKIHKESTKKILYSPSKNPVISSMKLELKNLRKQQKMLWIEFMTKMSDVVPSGLPRKYKLTVKNNFLYFEIDGILYQRRISLDQFNFLKKNKFIDENSVFLKLVLSERIIKQKKKSSTPKLQIAKEMYHTPSKYKKAAEILELVPLKSETIEKITKKTSSPIRFSKAAEKNTPVRTLKKKYAVSKYDTPPIIIKQQKPKLHETFLSPQRTKKSIKSISPKAISFINVISSWIKFMKKESSKIPKILPYGYYININNDDTSSNIILYLKNTLNKTTLNRTIIKSQLEELYRLKFITEEEYLDKLWLIFMGRGSEIPDVNLPSNRKLYYRENEYTLEYINIDDNSIIIERGINNDTLTKLIKKNLISNKSKIFYIKSPLKRPPPYKTISPEILEKEKSPLKIVEESHIYEEEEEEIVPERFFSNENYDVQCRKNKTYYKYLGKIIAKNKLDLIKQDDQNYKNHSYTYKCEDGKVKYFDNGTGVNESSVPFYALVKNITKSSKKVRSKGTIEEYKKIQAKNGRIMYFRNGKHISKNKVPQKYL